MEDIDRSCYAKRKADAGSRSIFAPWKDNQIRSPNFDNKIAFHSSPTNIRKGESFITWPYLEDRILYQLSHYNEPSCRKPTA